MWIVIALGANGEQEAFGPMSRADAADLVERLRGDEWWELSTARPLADPAMAADMSVFEVDRQE